MPNEHYCCESCFEHPWLKAKVAGSRTVVGSCFYCGTDGWLSPVQSLTPGFANLLSDYMRAEDANGGGDSRFPSVPSFEAIQRDWHLFTKRFVENGRVHFLPAVFKKEGFPSHIGGASVGVVAFHRNAMSTAYGKWMDFWIISDTPLARLICVNPIADIDIPGTFINQAAEHIRSLGRPLAGGTRLWRARTAYSGNSFVDRAPLPIRQMGFNPKCLASRLNCDGEPVLYCAEAEKTAIAEVRPGRGYVCTTCEVVLRRMVKVLDLASPLEVINPFTCSDLSWKLDLQRVVRLLSLSVAEPISTGEDAVVYSKTQFVSVIVRAMKLEGVRFRSSLDHPAGTNVALFDPAVALLSNPRLVKITNTEIAYEDYFDGLSPRER